MRQKKLKNIGTFLVFGGPSLFAFTAVVLIPLAFGLYLTFTNWNMATGAHAFIGLDNYRQIITDKTYLGQLWFTIKYALLTVVISNVGAFFGTIKSVDVRRRRAFHICAYSFTMRE